VGLDANFSVLDRGDAADLMDVLRQERGLSKAEKRFPRKDACLAIYSHRVNTQRPLAETLAKVFPWCAEWEQELTGLYRAYVERKLAHQALDYDDLLLYGIDERGRGLARTSAGSTRSGGRVPGHI
jgi:DNA helicase-2/ATP-dependent DNA helicase PcrA